MSISVGTMQYRMSQKMPSLCGCCGGAIDSIISDLTQLHRSGFNLSLRSFSSQSDTWLLIYGKIRDEAKLVVASKTALPLFFSNVKIK